ncbi:MAG: AAA family ATPase [Pseudomonadota bacterium]|nr:AAA family ATPase [Pseudomonadota bacterium]
MSPVTSDDAEPAAPCTPLFGAQIEALIRAGLAVIPVIGKVPRDRKWQLKDYDSSAEVAAANARGHNLGVRLADSGWLVVDVDPRNGGDESFERFRSDAGIALDDYPFVRTGGGGLHVYMRLPDGFEAVTHHDRYPGIDFKTSGQVVAPGSIHPETGKPYVGVNMDLLALEIPATDAALSVLQQRRAKANDDGGSDRAGDLTPRMLKGNLDQLQADDFTHDPWLELMMASHHATNGEGREEFIEWSTQAAGYSDHDELIGKRWDSFRVGQGGVTVATLFKRVIEAGGSPFDKAEAADDFDEYVPTEAELATEAGAKKRWNLVTLEQLAGMPPPRWIVDETLQEQSIAVVYGPPGAGKSFLAIDFALCMASGICWHGRKVEQGNVLYVAAEGARGLAKRTQAWLLHHALSVVPTAFQLVLDELNLANPAEAKAFIAFVEREHGRTPFKLVVIDTLSQTSTGADENSNTEMAAYFKRVQALVNATGATVIVVHHSGKDASKGERGAFAIRANIDTSIEVKRTGEGTSIALTLRKQKDGEDGALMELEMVKLHFNGGDGTPTSSLVLRSSTRVIEESDQAFREDRMTYDWIAKWVRENGTDGHAPYAELVKARAENAGVKTQAMRGTLDRMFADAGSGAVCSDGTVLRLRARDATNSRSPKDVCLEGGPGDE